MELKQTPRGFNISEFEDLTGNKCRIQESSLATESTIWLGVKKPNVTIFELPTKGRYITTDLPDNFMVNSDIHLTQDMVKELLPYLIKFAETGQLS